MARALETAALNRLRWRCRRGLLENDLVLARFLEHSAATLDRERLAAFEELLGLPDPELWALLSGQCECGDPRLAPMVAMLRAA